jgi:NAD+ kinase
LAPIAHRPSVTSSGAGQSGRRRVAVVFHPRVEAARAFALVLAEAFAARGVESLVHDAWDWGPIEPQLAGIDFVVSLGGDGTMLRTARHASPHGVPVIGVNFGRLAFLAELEPSEAMERLPLLLDGAGRVEERLMLRCRAQAADGDTGPIDALNEVFVGRGHVAHAVRLEVTVNDAPLVRFVADGLVVSTPTGSTAYSMSAGGPIVAPEVDAVVVTPVVSHPSTVRPLVLPAGVCVGVRVTCEAGAVLTVDGQIHHVLGDGATVRVERSPYRTRFLKLESPDDFYGSMMRRLRR